MILITRRRFVSTAAAGLVIGARSLRAAPATYDLIVKGGRVIDPASRLDGIRDVGIASGRIAAVRANLAGDGAAVVDARGKLVVPGLLDIHTHAARGADLPPRILRDGVTGWIDAGSQGADGIDSAIAVARSSPQPGRVLINIGRKGILQDGDTMDLANADVNAAREAIASRRDWIAGIKARLSNTVAGANDYEVLRRAEEVARPFNLPVMIHMGQTMTPLPKLLDLLKPGDVVTHMFAPPPNSIVDDAGRILPAVTAARRRGVWFDVGNGAIGHLRWDLAGTIMKDRFWPDTISTDWTTTSPTTGVIDLPNCLSKWLNFGMSVSDVIARATFNASRVFPVFKDRGTLRVGAPADIALLDLRDGAYEFEDNFNNKLPGRQRLFPAGTILNGRPAGLLAPVSNRT